MNIQINISKIQILRLDGPDKIVFTLKGPTPYPNISKLSSTKSIPPTFYQECQRGYAEKWLSNFGFYGKEVELITNDGTVIITVGDFRSE